MYRFAIYALVVALGVTASQTATQPPRATIRIDVSKVGTRVSPTLYGLFFEEINHAGDGGLYAEMVRNGSFEDRTLTDAWTASGGAEIRLDRSQPLNASNPTALRMEGRSFCSILNSGYWGIGTQQDAEYRVTACLRFEPVHFREGPYDNVEPKLISSNDASASVLVGRPTVETLRDGWSRWTWRIRATSNSDHCRLALVNRPGDPVLIDMVSLVPANGWRRTNLRSDLAGKLDYMRPAFVRFPGGCYCEGEVLKDAFRWKNSIGPIEQRPGHWNLWGYRSTDGLGYHEYLQMCEDLKAEPLFVINCGMSHRENVPLDQLDPWVQDAIDAIEYANGPVTSKWGALRAKAGHPKPFNMKYMEIGNENGWGNHLSAFEARYARFHDAIKARDPEMKLVANVPIRNRPMDIIDDHYYNSPEWFIANAGKYDKYDRNGPKVYVGEYAVTQGGGQGNLRAALAEAAFMMGLERNSDVVTLSSYAPLFVNVNDRKWNPDAICFDSSRSYGTPSYWVQQMFSRNRPDVNLPIQVTCPTTRSASRPHGKIGVGTWSTQAEFRDISVAQGDKTLLAPNLNYGRASGWSTFKGDWQAMDGVYRQTSLGTDMRSTNGDTNWSQYAYTLKARKIAGAEGFLIMFHVRDDRNFYWWNIGGWGNSRHAIEHAVNGAKSIVGNEVPGRIETGRWYDIRIEVDGSRIKCYLDGRLIHDVEDRGLPAMAAIAGMEDRKGELVLKVVNTSDSPQETEIRVDGTTHLSPEATATILTSGSGTDENTLDNPLKIAPAAKKVKLTGPRFRHTFPPNSLTIMRIKASTKH